MKFLQLSALFSTALLAVDAFLPDTSTRRHHQRHSFVLRQRSDSVIQTTSAQAFSGAGPAQVDMNQYNLPSLEDIAQEWTANLVPETAMHEAGAYLGAKSNEIIMVDTLKVELKRRMGEGLGIQLLELAGGREDGLGITVVDGFVEGGIAEGSGILEGDSIVKVALCKNNRKSEDGLEDREEIVSVGTECLGYDMTVEAIGSLPVQEEEDETLILTVKRLRRKPKVSLKLQYPPEMNEPDIKIELFSGENLRRAMLVKGVKLNDKLARRFDSGGTGDCGAEGTCATCAVSITSGDDLLNPPGSTEAQIFAENPRWRLACKTIVGYGMKEGELTVRVSPRQW